MDTNYDDDLASKELRNNGVASASEGGARTDLRILACGALMGGADVVPGVSGGTVALILGIYDRLVTAISCFDRILLEHLRGRAWQAAAKHIDLRFLIALGCGVVVGIGVMLAITVTLLEHESTRPLVLAAFFGLILSSGLLVARSIRPEQGQILQLVVCATMGLACALAIYYFTTFHVGSGAVEPSLGYLFFCGALAICAMILPGISGAMILVLLGTYSHVAHLPKNVVHGEEVGASLLAIAVVGSGCLIGLLSFSKLLRKLLVDYRMPTMAVMTGFIFGALPKLWPFDLKVGEKHYQPTWPTGTTQILAVLGIIIGAAAFVLIADWMARHGKGKE